MGWGPIANSVLKLSTRRHGIGFHRSRVQPCSHPSNHLSVHPCHPSIYTHRPIHPPNHLPVHPSIPNIHPSIPPSTPLLVLVFLSFLSSFRWNKLSLSIPVLCQIPPSLPKLHFRLRYLGSCIWLLLSCYHCNNFAAAIENYNTDFNMFTKSKLLSATWTFHCPYIVLEGCKTPHREEVFKRAKKITPQSWWCWGCTPSPWWVFKSHKQTHALHTCHNTASMWGRQEGWSFSLQKHMCSLCRWAFVSRRQPQSQSRDFCDDLALSQEKQWSIVTADQDSPNDV